MTKFLERLAPVWQPHPGQREFLENPSRFKVLACGRRWGKTDACAVQIVASFFEATPTRHVILAPTQDQANLLFNRALTLLGQVQPDPEIDHKKSPYPTITFNGHRLTARSGHLARALRGNEATHLIVDEASYLPESLITEVALPMLATTNGYLTLIGTPNGRNHFWRFYGMGQAHEHGVWSRTGPSAESPYVSKVFLAIQKELITDRAYRVEYEAEFMDSENQFFRTEAVESCLVMQLPESRGHICIGVDWGKNQDATAVAVVQGDALAASVLEVVAIEGSSWELLCERVAAVVQKYPTARVLNDETGNGNPMVELLKKRCPGQIITGLSFTNENKSEMAFGLAAMFEHRRLAMRPNPALQRELQYYEMTETDMGRPKFGAAQGLHDDLVTALMLANRLLRDPTGGRVMKGRQRSALFAG